MRPRIVTAVLVGVAVACGAPPSPAPIVQPTPASLPSLTGLVERVGPSVVNVEVLARSPHSPIEAQLGDTPFALRQGIGSGVIFNSRGRVLTNHHVVHGAEAIKVTLQDGRSFEAHVLGRDPLTDLAVLQLEGPHRDLPTARLGDSDELQVGDWVLAIGNPFGLSSSVSAGILSARERDLGAGPYDQFLQTDAAINPGHSGGPLFDLNGEVVGINTAIVGGGTAIGFAVPSSLVRSLLPALEKGQAVRRGWLGVSIQDLTPELARALDAPVPRGAVVGDVPGGSPGAAGGLRTEDVVTALDGKEILSAGELTRRIAALSPGSRARLSLSREGKHVTREILLGARPDLEGVGKLEASAHPSAPPKSLGLAVEPADPGARVAAVEPGSAAARADLQPGMVVLEAGGKPVQDPGELLAVLRSARRGSIVLLRIQAGRERILRALTLPE